ncbi:MAG: EF-Tu/IF-2/RF-3 family GTPase, partial [Candidatus Bathyarchaeia archaeon]
DQMVIAVNKMDDPTVDWGQERYDLVKDGVTRLLRMVGYDISKIHFVPTSGWTGDNLVEKSDKMPWYDGPTLYKALDDFEVPSKPIDKPLRIPVQEVYSIRGIGTVPVGRVETGVLYNNKAVVFMPSKLSGEVKSIETHYVRMDKAEPGDNIGFNVKGIARDQIRRGEVAGYPDNPPKVANSFLGQIFVIFHPTALAQGYTPVLHIHTSQIAVRFAELVSKLDPRTGQVIEDHPSYLRTGEAAIVKFEPLHPVALEVFSEIPQLGRFAVRDMGTTIAAGIVKEIVS